MTPAERMAALLRGDNLALAHEHIANVLAGLAEDVFKPGMKLTFIARLPGNDEADMVVTDDKLAEVAALVQRRRVADGEAL